MYYKGESAPLKENAEMKSSVFQEDRIYSREHSKLSEKSLEVIRSTVRQSRPVGFVAGYYDEELTITDVSGFFLQSLGYTFPEFLEATGGSLKKLIYGENRSFLEADRWPNIKGEGDGQLLTRDGVPAYTRLNKQDTVDEEGRSIWIMTAQVDWTRQNLYLVNNLIQSGMWYIDCDEEGNAVDIIYSHEFRSMLGYRDILDFPNRMESWSKLLHPDDKARTLAALKRVIQDRKGDLKYDEEYRMQMPDGSYHWFRDSAEASRRLDGSVRRMVGIFVNIDKRKGAEIRAKKGEAFHHAFTESNLCEYYLNLQTGRFDSLKDGQTMLTPWETKRDWRELVEQYLRHFVREEDRETVKLLYDRNYIAQKLGEGNGELNYECRIQKDGEERWVRNVVMPGDSEDPRYVIVFIRDITEARQEAGRMAKLTRQNQAMDLLIQGTTKLVDRFASCDLETDQYINYTDKKDGAYPPKGNYHDLVARVAQRYKAIGQNDTIQQLFAPETIRARLWDGEASYRFEYSTLDEQQFKSIAIVPLSWKNGRVEKVLLMAQDITQEKQAEIRARAALKDAYDAANRANSAKTEFLSNMSHDIRTPMNAIVGMTAIAGANIDNPERVADCLGKITRSSRHLLGLINEVLDMSRIESGQVVLTEEDFNFAELVDNLVTMARASIAEHGHDFEIHLSQIEHEDVCGDSLRIQQVITNILSNAIKYTPDGGKIRFSLAERSTQSSGVGCYEFTVEDNGIGMTPEFQKVLFEPFTRADDKRTSKIQGTGLGMAIARNIVNMMNGNIKVESAPDKGSRFTVTIFLKLQEKEQIRLEELVDLPVLVVDDDPLCCESTVGMLDDIGIDGESVTSGQEAVERTVERHEKNEDFFAIIMDWKMPGMDGVETTREIRRRVGRNVPIIVLTAYDYSEIEEEARAAGVNDFIAKPLFRSRLPTVLKNLVEGRPIHVMKNELAGLAKCHYEGRRILLVEDNSLNSEIAKELLEMTGASVETAEDGEKAVEKFTQKPEGYYDLIFMDIQMPRMNGYEAAAAIRSMKDHGGLTVPIVAMTANAFAEDIILAKNAGMNEHVAKPLDINKLNDVLRRWL